MITTNKIDACFNVYQARFYFSVFSFVLDAFSLLDESLAILFSLFFCNEKNKKMNITNSEQALKNYCKTKGYEKPIYTISSCHPIQLKNANYRDKYYVCSVKVNGQHLANGDGISKRIARKKAAMFGFQNLRLFEMSSMFVAFKNQIPLLSIGYKHQSSSNENFKSSLENKEILAIENCLQSTKQLEPELIQRKEDKIIFQPNKSPKMIIKDRSNSDTSEDLILAAIAKLRSYQDADNGTEHESKQNGKILPSTKAIINDGIYLDQQQIKELTKELKNSILENDMPIENELDSIDYIDNDDQHPIEFINGEQKNNSTIIKKITKRIFKI